MKIFEKFASIAIILAPAMFTSTACAQDAFFNIFNNIMHAAVADHARKDWSRISPNETACMEAAFEKQGYSIDGLIEKGIRPNDPSIASIRQDCKSERTPPSGGVGSIEDIDHLSEKPTFDCAKAKSATGRIVCLDRAGASADWNMVSASWAARFSLPQTDRKSFDEAEEQWLLSLNATCRLGAQQTTFTANQRQCVLRAYAKRAGEYRAHIRGDALAESKLSPEDHAHIQQTLISLGLLDSSADGEFGDDTRRAIAKYHQQAELTNSEFLSYRERERLLNRIPDSSASGACSVADPTGTPLNLRSAPNAAVTATLANGTSVRVLQLKTEPNGYAWALIAQSGDDKPLGWASRAYLHCPTTTPQVATDKPPKSSPPRETENLKQARFYLQDARTFISTQKTISDISAIADEAATLQIALQNYDEATASESMQKLDVLLRKISGFQQFENTALKSRQQDEEQRLADSKVVLSNNAHFLDGYMAKHLGDNQTSALVTLRRGLDHSLQINTIDEIQKANNAVASYVSSNGLSTEYVAATEVPKAEVPKSIETRLSVTDKSTFVVDGPDDEIILLYNVSSTAPNIWRNVRGDIVFQNDSASLCFAQERPDIRIVRHVEHVLRSDGAKKLTSHSGSCDVGMIKNTIDVVALVRGTFLKGGERYDTDLIGLINSDVLKKYKIVSDYSNILQAREALSLQIEKDLDANIRVGYGVIAVADSASACVIKLDKADVSDGLKELLNQHRDLIAPSLVTDWQFVDASEDVALLSLQKKQCGYVAGNASSLHQIMLALRRDQLLKFTFSPVWWDEKDLAHESFVVEDARQQELRKKAEDDRAAEERRALEQEREKNQQAEKTAIDKELRQKNGVRARGLLHGIDDLVRKQAIEKVDDPGQSFPTYSQWLADRFADRWDTFNVSSDVADFGSVQWGKRSLDAVIVKTVIQQKNPVLGKYEDQCFLFGIVDDVEFHVTRDHFSVKCSDIATVGIWKAKESFQSQWNAK